MTRYSDCTIDCTGDICQYDTILFVENVYGGTRRKRILLGQRKILAHVIRDSYGQSKQQHTFSLDVVRTTGYDSATVRSTANKRGYILRKGRNIYRNGTKRMPWKDENQRQIVLDEKHKRGAVSRTDRYERRCYEAATGIQL